MKIEKIDRDALRVLITAAERALNKELEPYGVTITPGRSKYSNGSTGTLQFDITAAGANPDKENFERCAGLMGIQASDYRRIVTINGNRYALVGIELGRPRFPFIGERQPDGKRFKLTDDSVRRALQAGL